MLHPWPRPGYTLDRSPFHPRAHTHTYTPTPTHSITQAWASPPTPIPLHYPYNFLHFSTRTSSFVQHTLPSVWLHSAAVAIVVVSLLSFRLRHQYLWSTCVLLPPRLCVVFCDLHETELGPSSDFLQKFACVRPNNSTVRLFWNIEAEQRGFFM